MNVCDNYWQIVNKHGRRGGEEEGTKAEEDFRERRGEEEEDIWHN